MGGEDHGHQARQGGETKQGGRHCGGTGSVEISELRNFQEKKAGLPAFLLLLKNFRRAGGAVGRAALTAVQRRAWLLPGWSPAKG